VDDVLDLYVEHFGPREALARPELLESAVALPQATMFGEDLYPDLFLKAAAMLRSIAQNQSFLDGNKRIAWLSMRVFLALNGFNVHATVDHGLAMMIELAENRIDLDGIREFLFVRAARRDDAATGEV
jgi:death-on-curing protein